MSAVVSHLTKNFQIERVIALTKGRRVCDIIYYKSSFLLQTILDLTRTSWMSSA